MNFLTSQKLALFGLANGQLVTYLKIQTKVFRVPSGTPMDWFLMKSVNAKYPLSCHKYVKKQTLCTRSLTRPTKCVTPPQKWYHHIAQGSAHLKPLEHFDAPLLLHWEKIDFLKAPIFWQKYSNGPGVAKNWHMSKLPKRGPSRCHKLYWDQIWQKKFNGSIFWQVLKRPWSRQKLTYVKIAQKGS